VSEVVKGVLEELDDIEDRVFDAQTSDATHIGLLRREIVRLRRTILPLKDIMADLPADASGFGHDNLTRYYRNITRLIDRLSETVDEAKETIEIYKDADFTASTAKTNEILAILTIIFTLAIPATVLGTFYGMNINLPGGIEAGAWQFFGTYTTLIVLVLASVVPAVFMYWYFKKKKWF
jgi:magnesium transporter